MLGAPSWPPVPPTVRPSLGSGEPRVPRTSTRMNLQHRRGDSMEDGGYPLPPRGDCSTPGGTWPVTPCTPVPCHPTPQCHPGERCDGGWPRPPAPAWPSPTCRQYPPLFRPPRPVARLLPDTARPDPENPCWPEGRRGTDARHRLGIAARHRLGWNQLLRRSPGSGCRPHAAAGPAGIVCSGKVLMEGTRDQCKLQIYDGFSQGKNCFRFFSFVRILQQFEKKYIYIPSR